MLSGRYVNIDDDGCTLFKILFNLRKKILLCNCEFENVEMKSAPGKEAMFLMRFFNAAIRKNEKQEKTGKQWLTDNRKEVIIKPYSTDISVEYGFGRPTMMNGRRISSGSEGGVFWQRQAISRRHMTTLRNRSLAALCFRERLSMRRS